MVRTLVLIALLLPALASAQVTIVETSDFTNGNDQIINIAECNGAVASRFTISWTLPTTAGTTAQVDLRVSDTSGCPQPSTSNTAVTKSFAGGPFSGTTGRLSSPQTAQNIVALLGFGCTEGQLKPLYICAVGQLGGTDVTNAVQTSSIQLDTIIPSPPVITKVAPGDAALDVSWDSVSGANRYQVTLTPVAGGTATDPGAPRVSPEITDTSRRIGGLVNNAQYSVTVVAITLGGNPSAVSTAVPGTPVQVNDFWRLYQNDNGQEQGGCGTPGAGRLSVLALLALAVLALRRRRALPLLALAAALSASPARATESPRYGSFQLRVVPYRPNIDAEFRAAGVAPYQEAFGSGKHLMFQGEVAYSLLKNYGSLDLGLGAGFWQAFGHGRLATDGSVSGDPTRLRIVPTTVSLTYRLDVLANRGIVPLAPYARVAFERYNWWVTNGSGAVTDASGKHGSGATNGYSLTGGVSLLLDFIDGNLAREMDNDTGINHTYLYAEVTKLKVDDFGSGKSWDLSTDGSVVVAGGLLFVF